MSEIKELKGVNMDVDLAFNQKGFHWKQDKCAVKNVFLGKYFKGIKYPDKVLCTFSNK
jgi:hypothetical protein